MSKLSALFLSVPLLLSSCFSNDNRDWAPQFDGTAYRPVYLDTEDVSNVSTQPAEELSDPGKIYLLEPYIFVNEKGRGIHVIDNSDPSNPQNISFISIPGNFDMAATGNWLYADNYRDLLTFDIADPKDVHLVKRIENAIPIQDFPNENQVYFECPDPAKGVIISWERVNLSSKPKCWR
jgi:hypothetical protein